MKGNRRRSIGPIVSHGQDKDEAERDLPTAHNNNSGKCAEGSQQINFGAEIFAPVNVIIVDYTALTLLD